MEENKNPIVAAVLKDPVVTAAIEEHNVKGERRTIPGVVKTQSGEIVAAPTTTEEQDRVSHGQRAINLIWEDTQRKIASAVVLASLTVSVWLSIKGETDAKTAAFVFLYGVANLVIGFYFGRTNHQKIGGVEQGR